MLAIVHRFAASGLQHCNKDCRIRVSVFCTAMEDLPLSAWSTDVQCISCDVQLCPVGMILCWSVAVAGSVRLSVLLLLTLVALQTSDYSQNHHYYSNIRHSMQVKKALQQQQMLQAAGGIEGLIGLLQTSSGDTSTSTRQTITIMLHHHTYQ